MDEKTTIYQEETQFLRTTLMGDIREDIQFVGLTIWDLCWIVVGNLLFGLTFSFLPINFILKVILIILTFVGMFLFRFLKIPYRWKRLRRYHKEPKAGDGSQLGETLGVEPDGPFYRSGKQWFMVFQVDAPPWNAAVYSQKRNRVLSFGEFLRACMLSHVDVLISWDQSPDYQWGIWESKKKNVSAHAGIEKIKQRRLAYFEGKAAQGEALRTNYYLRLSVNETQLPLQEREGEAGLTKEQIHRKRILGDLKELKNKLQAILLRGEHRTTPLSGFAVTEALATQWDPISWQAWKATQGTWDLEPESLPAEPAQKKKEKQSEGPIQERFYLAALRNIATKLKKNPLKALWLFIRKRKGAIRKRIKGKEENPSSPIHFQITQPTSSDEVKFQISTPVEEPITFQLNKPAEDPARKTESDQTKPQESWEGEIYFLTSPAPTGKSFLTGNIAVAHAKQGKTVTVLDLSADAGVLTYLNLAFRSKDDHWEKYGSRFLPGLALYRLIYDHTLTAHTVASELKQWQQNSDLVLVDLPWNHPWRTELSPCGKTAAVIDSDYHHWLQWEKAIESGEWEGEIWLNQDEKEVNVRNLIRDRWNRMEPDQCFPHFSGARRSLYQGRPLAMDESEPFLLQSQSDKGGKKEVC
jgi:hypothetical protein